ncbi:MAG: NUDIX hydrolase [Alphaproteobacteria bacterium]|nr:NUDIX hydrolase [Alphaproteobacteria bacterium]
MISKRVRLRPGAALEDYYVVVVDDWALVCPRLADGRFVMVEQKRPAVGRRMLEFPSGSIDPGETPAQAVRRELIEETGYRARRLVSLGSYLTDTGRLSNRGYLYFADVVPVGGWTPEPGVDAVTMTAEEIDRRVAEGRLGLHQVALWLLVKARDQSPRR